MARQVRGNHLRRVARRVARNPCTRLLFRSRGRNRHVLCRTRFCFNRLCDPRYAALSHAHDNISRHPSVLGHCKLCPQATRGAQLGSNRTHIRHQQLPCCSSAFDVAHLNGHASKRLHDGCTARNQCGEKFVYIGNRDKPRTACPCHFYVFSYNVGCGLRDKVGCGLHGTVNCADTLCAACAILRGATHNLHFV